MNGGSFLHRSLCSALAAGSMLCATFAHRNDSLGVQAAEYAPYTQGSSDWLGVEYVDPAPLPGPFGREIVATDVPYPFVTRFSAGHDIGSGIGIDESFTTFEWFMPLCNDLDQDMFFGDARGIIRNDATFGANLGLGYRKYVPGWDRIWGVNAYYDFRDGEVGDFNQLGLGFESLGRLIDFRGNFYLPNVGEVEAAGKTAFIGNIMTALSETAMTGGDIEAGVSLPYWRGLQTRVFGGGYYFDGPNTRSAAGWRVRAEASFQDRFACDVSIQDDKVFGSTAMVGISYRHLQRLHAPPHPPAIRPMEHMFFRGPEPTTIEHRLGDPVERLQNIVLFRERFVATDTMGNLFRFLHVVPGNPGDGSFENPYPDLTTALADPTAGTSIIYTPQGGDFTENVVMVPGSQILSNGPRQTIQTSRGTTQLPFSGAGSGFDTFPTLTGNVTMADNSRFSGFDVTGGATANGVADVTIDQSRFTNAAGDAIFFTNVDNAQLSNLSLSSTAGRGIRFDDVSANVNTVTITSASNDGVEINNGANDRTITLTNLTVSSATAQGIDVNLDGAGDLTLRMAGTNAVTSTGTAFAANTGGASTGDLILQVNGSTFSSTTGAGMNVDGTAGAGTLFVSEFANNAVSRAATGGALFDTVTFDADPTTAAIDRVNAGSLAIGAATGGVTITGDGLRLIDPTGDLAFSPLTIRNNNGTGLLVDTKGGGTIFNLVTAGNSTITTTNGTAMFLDPLTVDLAFTDVTSTNSPTSAIFLDTISGRISIGRATLNSSVDTAIVIQNTPAPLIVGFTRADIRSLNGPTLNDVLDTSVNNGGNANVTFGTLNITVP